MGPLPSYQLKNYTLLKREKTEFMLKPVIEEQDGAGGEDAKLRPFVRWAFASISRLVATSTGSINLES